MDEAGLLRSSEVLQTHPAGDDPLQQRLWDLWARLDALDEESAGET